MKDPTLGGVVDADDATVWPGADRSVRQRRRWPWIVALALLAALAAAAGAVAYEQREVAAEWRERALVMEEHRDDARGRTEALQAQLDAIADMLATSETDVTQLEDRIRELADEKAQAEDTATTVAVERDVLAQLSSRIANAVSALDACVDRMFELQSASVDAFNRVAAGDDVDVVPLNQQAQATTSFCNEARAAAAGAAAAADQIR